MSYLRKDERTHYMDSIAARTIGGVCVALCAALSKESVEVVADILRRLSNNLENHPRNGMFIRLLPKPSVVTSPT